MGKPETSIRRATLDDVHRTASLFARYREFYGQPVDEPSALAFLKARVSNGESVVLYAERDGKVIGFLQLYPGFSSIALAPAWTLNDLFVDEAERRTGVAALLIEQAQEISGAAGAVSLSLETAQDNTSARRLYEKLGFALGQNFLAYAKPLS